jgi:surface protein
MSGGMFNGASSFNQYIGDWKVSNETEMSNLFGNRRGVRTPYDASPFNQYIGDWDVSNVTDMSFMFFGASSFNQYIGDWDVSKVRDMSWMFRGANAFDQYIGDWDISKVTEMSEMFDGAALSTTNYDYILYNWSLLPSLQRDVILGIGDTKYSEAGAPFRQQLIDEFGWTINDGGPL